MRTLVLPLLLLTAVSHATEWRQSFRDVWVDGEHQRGARIYATSEPERLAIELEGARDVVVVEIDSGRLTRQRVSERRLDETAWQATFGPKSSPIRGTAAKLDERRWVVQAGKHTIVIAPHVGATGEISRDAALDTVPTWRELYEAYEPDPELVATLAGIDGPLELELTFGTWCGDSRRAVPRLLKTLDAANNEGLTLELTALSGSFDAPMEHIASRRLTNVPTLVVLDGEQELGRIVETPAGDSFAADLVAIANRAPTEHTGRWERAERLAAGTLTGEGDLRERWELWRSDAEDGGTLLHATLEAGESRLELWHRRDDEGRSIFVELTRTEGERHARTRANVRGETVTIVTRGTTTGIVRQTLPLPEGGLVTPSPVDATGAWRALGAPDERTAETLMVDGIPGGRIVPVRMSRHDTGVTIAIDGAPGCSLEVDDALGLVVAAEGCGSWRTEDLERDYSVAR